MRRDYQPHSTTPHGGARGGGRKEGLQLQCLLETEYKRHKGPTYLHRLEKLQRNKTQTLPFKHFCNWIYVPRPQFILTNMFSQPMLYFMYKL